MCGGEPEINIPQAPAAPEPTAAEKELQQLQLEFYRNQAPVLEQLQQQQLEFYSNTLPAAQEAQTAQTQLLQSLIGPTQQFAQQRADIISPLLQGQPAPGMFSVLGSDITGEEASFQRGRERVLSSLAEAGLLDSGVRAELENQLVGDIALASEQQKRSELANLLNIALGGAGQAVSEASALGGSPIQTALGGTSTIQTGVGAGTSLGQQLATQQQNIANFNSQIFQAQLEAAERERAARAAQYGALFQGIGQAGAGLLV